MPPLLQIVSWPLELVKSHILGFLNYSNFRDLSIVCDSEGTFGHRNIEDLTLSLAQEMRCRAKGAVGRKRRPRRAELEGCSGIA